MTTKKKQRSSLRDVLRKLYEHYENNVAYGVPKALAAEVDAALAAPSAAIRLSPATLSLVSEALTKSHNALLPIAQDEQSEKRSGPGRTACGAIERAQRALIRETRP